MSKSLIRTSLFSFSAAGSKVVAAVVLNKVLAITVGPTGYAAVGQLQNVITALTTIASAGVNTGVTKYTADADESGGDSSLIWKAASKIGLIGSIVVFISVVVFSLLTSYRTEFDQSLKFAQLVAGGCVIFYVINVLLLAILNGIQKIKAFSYVTITNNLVTALFTALMAYTFELPGALFALATAPLLVVLFTVYLLKKENWFRISNFFGTAPRKTYQLLLSFSAMALLTSVIGPLAQIYVRSIFSNQYGNQNAGLWEALQRVSGVYLTVVTYPIVTYYLPKFSIAKKRSDAIGLLKQAVIWIVPATILIAGTLYVFRQLLVTTLFSESFSEMTSLFRFQLIGDVVRATCWILSYFLLAKAMVVKFMIAEGIANLSYCILSLIACHHFQLEFSVLGYAASHCIYFIVLLILVKNTLSKLSA